MIPAHQIACTPRSRRLARNRAYYESTQYDGLPDFWTGQRHEGEKPVPLRERAPCVVYPFPKIAVSTATRFTFGEGRFPTIKVGEVKPDDALTASMALTKDEASDLEALVAALIEKAHIKPMMRTLMRHGLTVGTTVPILAIREGVFQIEVARAEHCEPEFRAGSTTELKSLTWCYQFNKLVQTKTGPEERSFYFRRDVSDTEYVVYEDAPVVEGKDPVFRRDDAQSKRHGYGFCPALWIKNLSEEYGGDVDGVPLYDDKLYATFDGLNFALSQRHRGINYWGTPQPWETGVAEGEGPAPTGRTATPSPHTREKNQSDSYGRKGQPARAGAPDQIWSYKGEQVKVGLLETSGAAFDATTKHVADFRQRLQEAMSIVLVDPSSIGGKGELTGRALGLMLAPMLAFVDELRECWWPNGLRALLSMMLRMIAVAGDRGTLFLPRVSKVTKVLRRFLVEVDGRTLWIPPAMEPIWGAYIPASNDEIKAGVETAKTAKEANLISSKTATQYVASDFAVKDVEAELEDIEEESAEAADERLAQARASLPDESQDAAGPEAGEPPEATESAV